MSDPAPERITNSKSNLIEVQHVGVTAKLQSPLKGYLPSSSSTETDNGQVFFHPAHNKKAKYNKFSNDTQGDSAENSTTDTSKTLYEMHAIRDEKQAGKRITKLTPTKIEFQLYNKPVRRRQRRSRLNNPVGGAKPKKSTKRTLFDVEAGYPKRKESLSGFSLFKRLRESLECMRPAKGDSPKGGIFFDELPEPLKPSPLYVPLQDPPPHSRLPQQTRTLDTRIGIYPFEHGCADYLRTTDAPPHLMSMAVAERATQCATRFWAEIFGSLHIGITFAVTFVLQTYRFLLYSLVNTLIVGMLHMTSDYLIKPLLTVLFNGYLQPPLIFLFNVLSSLRDLLYPIADALNNFMKPLATVGRSLRLVHATYNNRQYAKEV